MPRLTTLFGNGRFRLPTGPVAAEGRGKLESATLRRGGKTWSEPCDYLVCGFGFLPHVVLAAALGCRMGEAGVEVDEYQRTSVAGVYCAGEATGIGGLDLVAVSPRTV